MNIFFTSICPRESAENLCKVHVNKMYQESCQMLASALRLRGVDDDRLPGITHINHPSSVWVRSSIHNYHWLLQHTIELRRLHGKEHGYDKYFEVIKQYIPDINDNGFWDPPACMDEDIADDDDIPAIEDKYMTFLSRKYKDWQTRTHKRKVRVEFHTNRSFYNDGKRIEAG